MYHVCNVYRLFSVSFLTQLQLSVTGCISFFCSIVQVIFASRIKLNNTQRLTCAKTVASNLALSVKKKKSIYVQPIFVKYYIELAF